MNAISQNIKYFGSFLGHFEPFRVIWGHIWAILGYFWPFLGHFVAFLDKFAESSNFFAGSLECMGVQCAF